MPASIPGLSVRKTNGRGNESATWMKWAALSAAAASMAPARTFGWLATTAIGSPPRWASAQTMESPKVGWTSKDRPPSHSAASTGRMS